MLYLQAHLLAFPLTPVGIGTLGSPINTLGNMGCLEQTAIEQD